MRFLAFIFSLVISALSVYPCLDDRASDLHKMEIADVSHSPVHNDIHHCSPFCTCQCCQICVNLPSLPVFFVAEQTVDKPYALSQSLISYYFTEFYIPPKA